MHIQRQTDRQNRLTVGQTILVQTNITKYAENKDGYTVTIMWGRLFLGVLGRGSGVVRKARLLQLGAVAAALYVLLFRLLIRAKGLQVGLPTSPSGRTTSQIAP